MKLYYKKNLQEESIKTDTKADSHQGDIAKLLKEIVTAKKNGENIILNVKNELEVRGISIDNKGIPHLQSVAAIPQIIEKSIYISSVPNEDVQKNPNVVEYQHYVCGLKIGEEDYTVHALVGVDKNGNRYYDHNLVQIEKGKLLDHISGQAVITGFGTTPSTKLTTNSNRKVNNLISILQVNDAEISSSRQRINEIAFRKAQDELEDRGISIDNRELLDNYGLSNLTLAKSGDHVTLSKIVAAEQGKGNGTRFMEDLARLADANGWTLALTPDTSFGGTSVSRLKKFYKRFGFKDNKGRNTDFKTRESMVRKPQEQEAEQTYSDGIRFSLVKDKDEIKRLEAEPKVKVYRAMQLRDGKLYPPMAGRINGEWQNPIELGVWEQADEHPELAANGKFKLDKGNGKYIWAAYNPYLHTSRSLLNDQFSSAWSRPELVTVEVEVPESELTSGYKAEKAKDAVGEVDWKSGPVSGKLAKKGNPRKVILSRYDKPVRIVPTEEVAERIAEMLKGTDTEIPFNTVTPELREALEAQGVKISEPQKGNAGAAAREAYDAWNIYNTTNKKFNEQLTKLSHGKLPSNAYISVGMPMGALSTFMPDIDIIIKKRVITKARKKHNVELQDIQNLPSALAEPIFIFRSSPSSISVLTELTTKEGKNIFAAIELNVNRQMGHRFLDVNDILTIHGRDEENIILPIIENNSLLWVDKEKGLSWLSSAKQNSQAITDKDLNSATKIVKNFVNPKQNANKKSENVRFSFAEAEPTFYSNAERAVEGIKQEKATPEQWLAMITKNGGLKAGEDKYGLSNLTLEKSGDHVTLSKIVTAEQGKGNGTRFMEDLARLADANGWTLALTPDTSFGGTSVSRLKNFYKKFGFKDNKGRNTDFETRESMVRKPEKGKAGAAAKEAYREWKANEVDKKESSFGERSGVVSGNSSSEGLFRAGSEHLSRNAYPQRESDAKIQENTKYHYVRRKKSYDKGKKLLDYSKKRGKSLYSRHLLATMFYRSICHLHKSSSLSRPIWLQARKQGIHT